MMGIPTLLTNGNFEVQYQVVVENGRSVDLVDVSLVDDLKSQFGAGVFKRVAGLSLMTPPKNIASSIALNVAGWDGSSKTDLIDRSVRSNRLAAGDSFLIGFTVEINASVVTHLPVGKAFVSGSAVSEDGVALISSSGNQIAGVCSLEDSTDSSSAESTSLLIPRIALVKTPSDAVAKGDHWEVKFTLVWENTGTVALDRVEIFDDIAARFGGQFAGVTLGVVTAGESNTGATPIANTEFALDTSKSLVTSTGPLEVGDSFEVAFTVTIDPSVEGTAASGLESRATSYGLAVDPSGDPITFSDGAPAITYRVSADGVDSARDHGRDNLNGVFVDYPTSAVIADVSLRKSILGNPQALPNGNFAVTYELVTENTGTIDLADLLLAEDLSSDSGSVLDRAGNAIITSAPTNARSHITLNSSWNGVSSAHLVKQSSLTRLAVGDSFSVQFTVEIDAKAAGVPPRLESQVVSGVEAVEEPIEASPVFNIDQNFAPEVAVVDPTVDTQISSVEGNHNPSDKPSPSYLPDITITKAIVADPVLTDRGNYVVTYQLSIENTGTVDLANLSLQEDLFNRFGPLFVKAGNLLMTSDPSDPQSKILVDSAGWNGKISTELLDGSAANVLVSGDSFTIQFDVEVKPKRGKSSLQSQTIGNANRKQSVSMGDQINGFIDAPGPIYSGTPIIESSSTPALGNGPANAGRYSVHKGSIFSGV